MRVLLQAGPEPTPAGTTASSGRHEETPGVCSDPSGAEAAARACSSLKTVARTCSGNATQARWQATIPRGFVLVPGHRKGGLREEGSVHPPGRLRHGRHRSVEGPRQWSGGGYGAQTNGGCRAFVDCRRGWRLDRPQGAKSAKGHTAVFPRVLDFSSSCNVAASTAPFSAAFTSC